jgi:hypothetical protein
MIGLTRSIPARFNSMIRSNIPTTVDCIIKSPLDSSAKKRSAVTPQGVTMVGMASGVIAGILKRPS